MSWQPWAGCHISYFEVWLLLTINSHEFHLAGSKQMMQIVYLQVPCQHYCQIILELHELHLGVFIKNKPGLWIKVWQTDSYACVFRTHELKHTHIFPHKSIHNKSIWEWYGIKTICSLCRLFIFLSLSAGVPVLQPACLCQGVCIFLLSSAAVLLSFLS